MDLYTSPDARARIRCLELAVQAGAASPSAAIHGARQLEAYLAAPRSTPGAAETRTVPHVEFKHLVDWLTGQRWTREQADELTSLINQGAAAL